MFVFFIKHKKSLKPSVGFSLIELMVTIAIITLVTGIALSRYGSFNNSVILKAQAYQIAFDIRQAQMSAVSVNASLGGANRNAFGIHFAENSNSYVFFQDSDVNNNNWYDGFGGTPTDNAIETFLLDPRFTIINLNFPGCTETTSAGSVTFERPNFDAIIKSNISSSCSQIEIEVAPTADASAIRTVTVFQSGQITVQ